MKREFSVEEFLEALEGHDTEEQESIAVMIGAKSEPDDKDEDDDDEGGELVTNAQELREISMMLGVDTEKSKT